MVDIKVCPRCEEEKPLIEFAPSGNGRSTYCRPCKQTYDRAYWQKTKARRNDQKKLNKAAVKERNFLYVLAWLNTHPCLDCGEVDPVVLEFDHVDPSTKSANISEMVDRANSIRTIQTEIDKCEVVCANCHRRRTAKMFDWRCARVLP